MTQQHPIAPSPELLQHWYSMLPKLEFGELVKQIYAAGADQELEACCEWVSKYLPYLGAFPMPEDALRAARRPKPSSLKEQAIAVLEDTELDAAHENILRRALEQLDD